MKDDWAKRLKDSLEGYSESVDDRVWERISPSPSAPRFIWWPFALAAAAVALVVFLFMPRGSVPEEDIVAVIQEIPTPVQKEIAQEQAPENITHPRTIRTSRKRSASREETEKGPSSEQETLIQPEQETVLGPEQEPDREPLVETEARQEDKPDVQSSDNDSISHQWERYLADNKPVAAKKVKADISIFAGVSYLGERNISQTRTIPGGNSYEQPPVQQQDPPDGPGVSFPDLPSGDPGEEPDPSADDSGGDDGSETKASPSEGVEVAENETVEQINHSHHLPLQVGLRASVSFGRIGVESGLTYMRFVSDMSSYTQYLHFVGVPLRVDYGILYGKNYTVYASVGAQALKCVAGNGPDRPWLFSVDVSAGFEYLLTGNLGLYLEPGIGRYFHTGATEHYYTVNPFMFTVSAGLRFSFGPTSTGRSAPR